MAKDMVWTKRYVASLAPDEASIPAAEKVLKKGGFGTVEATADGRGWWVVCQGLTGEYQVTVRRLEQNPRGSDDDHFEYRCTCPSSKIPCKHALALLLYLVEHPEIRPEVEGPKVAASDFEGLLRSVFREPEDDTARLVFADFLEENNQPDRAALIRYQCEAARLKPQSARGKELKKLITPLVAKLNKQIQPLPEGMRGEFQRGFLHLSGHLTSFADFDALPARITNLFHDGWVETIFTFLHWQMDPQMLLLLPQVGELDVSRSVITDEVLLSLVADTQEARTTGRLMRVKVHSKNRKEFARLLRAQQGEEIDFSANLDPVRNYYLDQRTFPPSLRFGRLSGARDLAIRASLRDLGDAEAAALTTADLSELRQLTLEGWRLNKAGVEALANSPALANLTTLRLDRCNVRAPGVAVLVGSPLFTTIRTLDLSSNPIGKGGVAALLKAEVPTKLKKLILLNCDLTRDEEKKLKAKYGTKVKVRY